MLAAGSNRQKQRADRVAGTCKGESWNASRLHTRLDVCSQPAVKRVKAETEDSDDVKPPKSKKARKVLLEPIRRSTRLVETAEAPKDGHVQLPDDFSDSDISRKPSKYLIKQLPAPVFPEYDADAELDYDPDYRAPPPIRDPAEENSGYGKIRFQDTQYEDVFRPNLTPKEMMQLGSFGGTYWRHFHSMVCRKDMPPDYDEFPSDWCQCTALLADNAES